MGRPTNIENDEPPTTHLRRSPHPRAFRVLGFLRVLGTFLVPGRLSATLPDAAGAGEGLEVDPDFQKHEKTAVLRFAQKCCFSMVFKGLDRFPDLPQPQRHQAKLPKAVPRPKKTTKTPETHEPEKPSEGTLPRCGGHKISCWTFKHF